MKRLSLQWRITLMTALLIAGACICLNLLLYRSGASGMDNLNGYVLQYQQDGGEDLTIEIPEDVRLSGAILARGLRYKDDFWPQRVVHYGSGDAVQRSDCLFYQRQSAETTERAGTAGREGRSG